MTDRHGDPRANHEGGDGAIPDPPAELRDALVAGVARHRRRRGRLRLAAGGGASALALAGAVVGIQLSQGPSAAIAAAFAIEPRGTWIDVRIVNADAGSAQMARELRGAGIDTEVRVIPTIERHVGEWMGVQQVGREPSAGGADGRTRVRAQRWRAGDIGARGAALMIRRDALDRFDERDWVFYIGRRPDEGESAHILYKNGPGPVRPG